MADPADKQTVGLSHDDKLTFVKVVRQLELVGSIVQAKAVELAKKVWVDLKTSDRGIIEKPDPPTRTVPWDENRREVVYGYPILNGPHADRLLYGPSFSLVVYELFDDGYHVFLRTDAGWWDMLMERKGHPIHFLPRHDALTPGFRDEDKIGEKH